MFQNKLLFSVHVCENFICSLQDLDASYYLFLHLPVGYSIIDIFVFQELV